MIKDSVIDKKQTEKKGHTFVQWGIAVLVNLSVITYGLQIGWTSPVLKLLQSHESHTGRALTDNEISWIASLPPLLSAFCASPYSWVVDRYGRRFGIMSIGVAQALCWGLTLTADPTCLLVSRVFTGIAAAACYNIIPMHIKIILTITSLISVVSFVGLAVIIMIQNSGGYVPSWLPVFVLVAGEFAFAAGVSPLPFIIMSEMFNFQIRAKVMGILAGTASFTTFLQLIAFGQVTSTFGAHVSFFGYAVVNFLAIVIAVTLLPETKGKTVEQIEYELVGKKEVKNNSNGA